MKQLKFRAWHTDKKIMMDVSKLIFYNCELHEIACDWKEIKKNRYYCGNKGCHSECGNEFIKEDYCHREVDIKFTILMQ